MVPVKVKKNQRFFDLSKQKNQPSQKPLKIWQIYPSKKVRKLQVFLFSHHLESKKDTNENVRSLSNHISDISIDIDRRVERWAQSFENLLADPVGLRCFQVCFKFLCYHPSLFIQ